MSTERQVCFLSEDGQWWICNAVYRNGHLVFAKGRWYRFPADKSKKRKAKETAQAVS